MSPQLTAALPLIIGGLLLVAFGLWLVLRATRRAKVIDAAENLKRDVLDEGAARAARNQALIDAAPAAEKPAPAPVPAPAAAPAPAPAPSPVPAPPASADDLTRIKGLGPKIAAVLAELGVTSFAQIASWTEQDVAAIDAQLGRFSGRITLDQWIAQAQMLAAGDEAGFAAKFGQNG
jgi:predicted flap endonuclease-1-like 5' DNA nuclease